MKSWCLPHPGAMFVAKMEDVLDVYTRPFDGAYPVVCVDEARKELHSTPRGALPVEPGQPRRENYVHERHGTANIFVSVEPLSGKRRIRITDRHTKLNFVEEIRCILEEDGSTTGQRGVVLNGNFERTWLAPGKPARVR